MTNASWAWMKNGHHVDEGNTLIAKFVQETGTQYTLEDVSVRTAKTPDGIVTVLVADGAWWRDQMAVHPNGWVGGRLDVLLDHSK